eukprot:NODE_6080_length_532_cov_109.180124_g5324_i0.p2 GENE.NODE_6080_length_532_cov_109.180124_g5324_i0~~NODE_6080_length_532_cov_109.180124_g5324_i0.p2  ORF type:complete len:97 (+),score=20.61 NODE_6080_length_532_cov_109.180124_g5324_i0:162-452(+)
MLKEYNCSRPSKSEINPGVREVKDKIKPALMVAKATKKKEAILILSSLQLFVDDLAFIQSVLTQNYKGGNYCAGVVVGQSGGELLLKILDLAKEFH